MVTLADARHIIAAAEKKATAIKQPMNIAVVDAGIPLKENGKVVGAIGVSGGKGKQDQAVAEAGAAAF
jgi:uncharacterized protein GlcG (DUF336 family)